MKKKGFTLIELVIVIGIIAILAGAIMPMFSVSKDEAKMTKAKAEMDTIKTATYTFHFDTKQWPIGAIDSLVINRDANGNPIPDWNGPYVDQINKDPWGQAYFYSLRQNSPTFPDRLYIVSDGPDGYYDSNDVPCPNPPCGDDIFLMVTDDYTR